MRGSEGLTSRPYAFYEKIWLNETGEWEERNGFNFLIMTGEKYKSANSPPSKEKEVRRAYWQLSEGMNIRGSCDNMECPVFGRRVTLQVEGGGLGFGSFDMRKEMPSRFLCPECMKACNGKVVSCSFYRCRWRYEGEALEWSGIDDAGRNCFATVKKSGGGLANMTNGYLYCDTATSLTKWTQLKIVVEKIENFELVKLYSSSEEDSESQSFPDAGEEEEDEDEDSMGTDS